MAQIVIHESTDDAGRPVRTLLSNEDGELALTVGDEVLPLPEGALEAVMRRYGKELAIGKDAMNVVEQLEVGEGRLLVRFRFMARYDVIARDYVALLEEGREHEGLCELATAVTAALAHLARRHAGS